MAVFAARAINAVQNWRMSLGPNIGLRAHTHNHNKRHKQHAETSVYK